MTSPLWVMIIASRFAATSSTCVNADCGIAEFAPTGTLRDYWALMAALCQLYL